MVKRLCKRWRIVVYKLAEVVGSPVSKDVLAYYISINVHIYIYIYICLQSYLASPLTILCFKCGFSGGLKCLLISIYEVCSKYKMHFNFQ